MQRDSWYAFNRRLAALDDAASVGREAARRALRRLGARRVPTTECPVVFDPETAASLLRHLAGAIAGSALYRRASFLLDRLGDRIAAPTVTVVDDPLRRAAPRRARSTARAWRRDGGPSCGRACSRPISSTPTPRAGWGSRPTGNASRAAATRRAWRRRTSSSSPARHTPEAIIGSVSSGLYVTELIGFGVNLVTGDYSRGAAGLWIEDGELGQPVEEMTIAGNLRDVLAGIEMVGSDLVFRGATSAPTIKVGRMTVAGA